MIAVVARHYLDALAAVPDDPDVPELRELAIAALVRAGERSQRAGAQAPAGVSYAAAAACIEQQSGPREDSVTAAQMYERAADAAILAIAYDDADRARQQGPPTPSRSRRRARRGSGSVNGWASDAASRSIHRRP